MKKIISVVVVLFFVSAVVSAGTWGGFGYMLGYAETNDFWNNKELPINSLLRSHGFSELSPLSFGFGGGGGSFMGDYYFGGWGGGSFSFESSNTSSNMTFQKLTGVGGLEGGFIFSAGSLVVIPTMSFLWGSTEYSIMQVPTGVVDFETALSNPGYKVDIVSDDFDIGAGVNMLFNANGFMGVMVKAMYFYRTWENWYVQGTGSNSYSISGVPKSSPHRFFLGVGFAFGGFHTGDDDVDNRNVDSASDIGQ
ncbi:hypothetical protein WKV44_03105 [Spirochaetia bacterium 38H-sp]|uniref:Outer membrane protein beta-barrel domain-containing protein n=1 Tax=Rarispira pelagica TaxID=3141764 RepID=A0ABU9UA27_9SPIR